MSANPAPSSGQERVLLKRLLELHDLKKKNNANNYDAVRQINREWDSTWERARILIYGPKPKEASPTEAQREQWEKRSKAAAVRRANELAEKENVSR